MISKEVLSANRYTRDDLVWLLSTNNENIRNLLFRQAYQTKKMYVGNVTYLRGLIEISNICKKDCLYCGIRKSNHNVVRYTIEPQHVIDLSMTAWRKGFGSVVIQSGERTDPAFIDLITQTVEAIRRNTGNEVGITLSCGEQTADTYRQWFAAGAHRYLLRIETSNEELFNTIHPQDGNHLYKTRLDCLESLRKIGYQTGTGVMIGLPGQTPAHLAEDLIFFKEMDVDMIGMGPFISHRDTPMGKVREDFIPTADERLELSLRMIALARIILKDVNITASTAMQTLDPDGRIKAILAGANVFMPNMTPEENAKNYFLYDNKPLSTDQSVTTVRELEDRLEPLGEVIGYGKWGDSKHYFKRIHLTPSSP